MAMTSRRCTLFLAAVLLAACGDGGTVAGPGISVSDSGSQHADGHLGDVTADVGRTAADIGGSADAGSTTAADAGTPIADSNAHDGGPVLPGELVALTLSPPLATLPIGAAITFELVGKFDDGSTAVLSDIAKWTSTDSSVASISPLGVALATGAGDTTIEAAIAGKSAKAQLSVTPLQVTELSIEPAVGAVAIGAALEFSAIATLQDGSTENISAAVDWSSAEAAIATVDGKGIATGVGTGTTTITATLADLQATATLEVLSAKLKGLSLTPVDPVLTVGAAVAFAVEASYEDGSVAEVTKSAAWSSSAPTVVVVDDGGVATALSVGTAIVEAKHGGLSASRVVTVDQAQLDSLVIEPDKATIAAGAKQLFKVTGSYGDGSKNDLTGSAVWTVEPGGIAVVSNAPGSQGTATGIGPGAATVKATFAGKSALAELVVSAALLQSITISPANPKVPKGIKLKARAHGSYSDGKVIEITDKVVWSSADTKVVTVSNGGETVGWLQGIGEGKTTISASLGGITGSTSVTVSAAALVKVVVTPATFTLPVGLKQAFTAAGEYSDGAVVDVTNTAVWSTSDSKMAVASNATGVQGLITGLAAGKVQVKASLGGLVGIAEVVVTTPELVEVTIGPHNLTRKAGQHVQYFAIAVYSNNTTQNVTGQASWSSSPSSVASIQSNGNFKGVAKALKTGKATISVAFKGKEASTSLTVVDPELLQVQISPAAWSTAVGLPMQFQAVALFSDDTTQNVTFQSNWTSANTKIAQVGNQMGGPGGLPKGRVMTIQPGTTDIKATFQGMSGSAKLTVTPAEPTGLSIFPGQQQMPVGQFRAYAASLVFSDGQAVQATQWAAWTSSDSSVAAALNGQNQKGLVQGLKAGTATITAVAQGFKATAKVVVTNAEAKELQLMPGAATVAKGVPVKFNVVAVFSDDTSQNVTGQASFTSSDPSVAVAFNGGQMGGLVQTLTPGKTTIKVSWKGLSAAAEVVVKLADLKSIEVTPTQPKVAPGSFLMFQAVAVYTDDTTQQITPLVSWQSSNPAVATISNLQQGPGKGITQALVAGTTTISASWAGKTGSTILTVQSAALVEIQVTPFAPILPLGYMSAFKATGIFSDYTVQDLTYQASWTSSATKVAAVGSIGAGKGLVTPQAAGKAVITAAFQGKKGTSQLTVTAAKLKSMTVEPASASMKVQQEQSLQALGTFDDGTKLNLTYWALWQTDKAAVANVSNAAGSKGVVKALGPGQAVITALRDGIKATAKVTVQ